MLLILTALSGLAAAFAAPIVLSGDDDDEETNGTDRAALDSAENILDAAYPDDAIVQDTLNDTFVQDLPSEVAGPDATDGTFVQDAPANIFVQDAPTDIFVQDAPVNIFVQDALPEGETFGLEAGAGTFEFEDFDPRVDVARIDMPDDAATIQTGLAPDGTPEVSASLSDGSEMTLTFPGLSEVPEHAIEFSIPREDGDDDMVLSLSSVLELGSDAPTTDGLASSASSFFVMEDDFDHLGLGALDDPIDDLDELLPLAPGSGDAVDGLTDPLDDLLPTAPGGGDDIDTPVDPLTDVDPVAPGSGDDDGIIPVPLPDGYSPLSPSSA